MTLADRETIRKSYRSDQHNEEENEWSEFWKKWSTHLFLQACEYGSLESVKFLHSKMKCSLEEDSYR